jgi:hypothetical protein
VHLPRESDQVAALLKDDKWPLKQTKKVRLQLVAVLWRMMGVVAIKKIQNRLQ